MDNECSVCYCEQATCKLICNHSFCKSCVKTWYQKSSEPTCPMCRHTMYFKGLHKISEIWQDERIEKQNEEAFNIAFDAIFEDEDESESESEESESESEENESEETGSDSSEWENWDFQELIVPPNTPLSEKDSEVEEEEDDNSYLIKSIIKLQIAYHKAIKFGVNIPSFLEDDNYMFYELNEEYGRSYIVEDDIFPHQKHLFISKHKDMIQNKQTRVKIPSKSDMGITIVFIIEYV